MLTGSLCLFCLLLWRFFGAQLVFLGCGLGCVGWLGCVLGWCLVVVVAGGCGFWVVFDGGAFYFLEEKGREVCLWFVGYFFLLRNTAAAAMMTMITMTAAAA